MVNPMAHLTIEYSANLDAVLDMSEFCEIARRAMQELACFPLAGIRVRALRADDFAVGDGGDELAFADMVLRMGKGRSHELRVLIVETLYSALEEWIEGKIDQPFALSLELLELNSPFTEKRLNTIRPALRGRGYDDA